VKGRQICKYTFGDFAVVEMDVHILEELKRMASSFQGREYIDKEQEDCVTRYCTNCDIQ